MTAPAQITGRRERRQGLRNMELGFLVVAYIIVLGALLQVQLGVNNTFDWHVVTLFGALLVLTLGVHIVLRFRAPAPTRSCCRSPRRSMASASR